MAKGATSIEPEVLEELNRLRAARDPIAGWLAGLEAERESVSEPVYRRVREDYAKRIADLDGLARPLRVAATRAIAAFDEQLSQLETEKGAVEVDLQEVELRRFLEEYSADDFEEHARVPRERLAELGRQLEEISATRELWLAARGEAIPEAEEPAAPAAAAAKPVDASTAAVSIAPTPPTPVLTPAPTPAPAPSPALTTVAPPMPPAAPMSTVPVGAEVRPLSPASITMPRPIPPPRPSSPAIPLPNTADAAAHTVHLPGPPPAPMPAAPPAASSPAASGAPPSPAPLDRTVVFTPEPPSPAPAAAEAGISTQRLQATLVPVEPGDAGGGAAQGHVLAAANTIGRVSDNAIQIQHGSVSRHHAILRFTAEGWTLEDLKAENGTWVNGERIDKRQLLDGDRVNIGTVRFLFQLG